VHDPPAMGEKLRLGVLGSGRGSNFAAVLKAIKEGRLGAEIAVVVSDQPEAGILRLAEESGIPSRVFAEPRYRTRLSPEVEEALVACLQEFRVDLVVLAGYMRVVKSPLLQAFPSRVVNIHPSLLPRHRGLAAWKQALEAGDLEAGCTVHLVDEGIDTGRILAQACVPILPRDTAESLHARIQEAEHRIYPEVLQRLVEGRL